jgi:hypothetical protein
VASGIDLSRQLREVELDQHLEQAAAIGAVIGLGSEELEERLRIATDRVKEKELK